MTPLKLHRLLRDLSQETLASRAGMSQGTFSRIERQIRAATALERERIAGVLGIATDVLFGPDAARESDDRGPGR